MKITKISFSALEDEPWIEATATEITVPALVSFSALEDEPWIEARQRTTVARPL